MKWRESDLKNLKKTETFTKKAILKTERHSKEKQHIDNLLFSLVIDKKIKRYEKELKFDSVRKFRFDWAIPEHKIAIEYEGVYNGKSRHTTTTGYSKDTEKYNLAVTLGWRVLRYTASTYKNVENDIKKIIQNFDNQ